MREADQTMSERTWSREVPTEKGWYWLYNGHERKVVIVDGDKLYTSEKNANKGCGYYRFSQFPGDNLKQLYWMPCEPPGLPQEGSSAT